PGAQHCALPGAPALPQAARRAFRRDWGVRQGMDHERIEAQNVIERYVMGRLAPEEEALFEEHLLECRDCRQSIEREEDFQGSLQTLAAGEAARATAAVQMGALAWLTRRR